MSYIRIILFTLVFQIQLFSQAITISTDFEGGNAQVIAVNNSENYVSVKPQYRPGDTRASHFFFKAKGFKRTAPFKVKLYTDEDFYAPELAAYSYDLVNWNRVQAVHYSDHVEYTRGMTSDSVYFAFGFPYLYSDMIKCLNNAVLNPNAEVSNLTTSSGGNQVKLLKITDKAITDSSKCLIWVLARQHAFEAHSNYVIEGLINFLTSEDNKAKRLLRQSIIYIVPIMDVDKVIQGGTGKDQNPVDFNRDWDSPSYWNAVNAVKLKMAQTAAQNSFKVCIDSHDPWPSSYDPESSLFLYSLYQSGTKSENIDLFRNFFLNNSGYQLRRFPMYATEGMTAMSYVDSAYNTGLNFSIENGWVRRPDDSLWTIDRYKRNGLYLGEALSDYINNLSVQGVVENNILNNPEYSLYNNYPNPFNNTTTIEFYLREDSKVNITIFDALGKEIKAITSQNYFPGYYKIVWNGCDNQGNEVTSGIYFYRLSANNRNNSFISSKKMILVK